ncbi:MAG: 30S ribosomal protein S5 [Patescibacteria group bacterium]
MARVTVSKRKEDQWQQKLLEINRVTRVVGGGKRLSFRVVMVIGDFQSKVGVGVAKAGDVSKAIEKSIFQAQKNIIEVPIVDGAISREVEAKHSSARILIKPGKKGRGLIAGGPARIILSFAGVKDAVAKNLGRTTNKLTNATAAIKALKKLSQ